MATEPAIDGRKSNNDGKNFAIVGEYRSRAASFSSRLKVESVLAAIF
jgi:hypothetical protein